VLPQLSLSFEDFLEALVRLAMLVPNPTPAELEEAGYTRGGEYLAGVVADQKKLKAFKAANQPRLSPMPCHQRVALLLATIVGYIEYGSTKKFDGVLSTQEIEAFSKSHNAGAHGVIIARMRDLPRDDLEIAKQARQWSDIAVATMDYEQLGGSYKLELTRQPT
jgi:hypothetical protein